MNTFTLMLFSLQLKKCRHKGVHVNKTLRNHAVIDVGLVRLCSVLEAADFNWRTKNSGTKTLLTRVPGIVKEWGVIVLLYYRAK